MDAVDKINDADCQASRTGAILKAVVLSTAIMLQNRIHAILVPTDEELCDIGWGLEYALEDAEMARIASEEANKEYGEAKLREKDEIIKNYQGLTDALQAKLQSQGTTP